MSMDIALCPSTNHGQTNSLPIPQHTSVFERYLIALPDRLRHSLFETLPLPALFSLSQTSTFVYFLVKLYERMAWNLPRFLCAWFKNPVGFMHVLEVTSAVISGSQAIGFMDRLRPIPHKDLDIFVDVEGFERLGSFIVSQGYSYHQGMSLASTNSYANLKGKKDIVFGNRWRLERCRDAKTIVAVLNFFGPHYLFKQVQVIVVAVDPVRFILTRFHSTAVMNVITARQAISIFPRATFLHRVSYVSWLQGSASKIAAWKEKYTRRGFSITESFNDASAYDDFSVGRRSVGDCECWVLDTADSFVLYKLDEALSKLSYPVPARQIHNIKFQVCLQRQVDYWHVCRISITEVWPYHSSRTVKSTVEPEHVA